MAKNVETRNTGQGAAQGVQVGGIGQGTSARPDTSGHAQNVQVGGLPAPTTRSSLIDSVNRSGTDPNRGVSQGAAPVTTRPSTTQASAPQAPTTQPQVNAAETMRSRQKKAEKKEATPPSAPVTSGLEIPASDVTPAKDATKEDELQPSKKTKRGRKARQPSNTASREPSGTIDIDKNELSKFIDEAMPQATPEEQRQLSEAQEKIRNAKKVQASYGNKARKPRRTRNAAKKAQEPAAQVPEVSAQEVDFAEMQAKDNRNALDQMVSNAMSGISQENRARYSDDELQRIQLEQIVIDAMSNASPNERQRLSKILNEIRNDNLASLSDEDIALIFKNLDQSVVPEAERILGRQSGLWLSAKEVDGSLPAVRMQLRDKIPTSRLSDVAGIDVITRERPYSQDEARDIGKLYLGYHQNDYDSYRMQQLATENMKARNAFIEESVRNNQAYQEHIAEAAVAHEKELKEDLRNGLHDWTRDVAFEWHDYAAGKSRDDIREDLIRRTSDSGTIYNSIGESRHSPADFDYNETAADNVLRAQAAADSTARIIANPLMIKIEGLRVETRPMKGKTDMIQARLVFDDDAKKNVKGAIMSVMNSYGCGYIEALGVIYTRLGLGVDSHGKILGKPWREFELPAITVIEAAHDIVESQNRYGHPLGIVKGKPFGVAGGGSRDRTGMFPVLGGTRCYPLGYLPRDLFHKLREDASSKLYGMTDREFYGIVADSWLNVTQPSILANTDGPLGWQAAALNMAMEGLMNIDGVPLEDLNVPEYATFRTREMLQADLMDAGDEAAREAYEAKMEYYPEVMNRFAREHFKDSKFRTNPSVGDDDSEESEIVNRSRVITPGNEPCSDGFLGRASDVLDTYWSATSIAQALHLGNMLTAPLEGAMSTAEQQVVITMQNAYKSRMQKKWHMNGRFDSTEYLSQVVKGKDAIEALEVAETLMRVGGRAALDAFRMDMNDRGTKGRYHMTKKDMHSFLKKWGANESGNVMSSFADRLMIGDGMFKRTQAQQFLDMAMYEMMQSELHGGEVLDSGALEEISRAGGFRSGSGEALVSALLDTRAGYEAFKSMGATSLKKTTTYGRAVDYVMNKNGVTNTAVRMVLGNFPVYHMNRIARLLPGSNTFSYLTSYLIRKAGMSVADRAEVANGFMRGFNEAAQALTRVSDYQMGMSELTTEDWGSFKSGLYKNLAYDAVTFGGNYVVLGALHTMVLMLLGGIRPPEDDKKLTLAEEWIVNNLNVPVKLSWFMDDLLGCGAPLSYAWLISFNGYDRTDKDGNVIEHVEGGSEKANQTAASVFNNMVRSFNNPRHIIDAIDFVTNFDRNVREITNPPMDDIRKHYGDDISKMSESEIRNEWLASRVQSLAYDLFGNLTPPILNEILPGTRDSLWSDKWQHDTSKRYMDEKYGHERAVNEDRTQKVSFLEYSRMEKTQDNVILAFLNDVFRAQDGIEYQYANMPIRTTGDPRALASESYREQFGLNLELPNGEKNLDLDGKNGTDTMEEREKFLFSKAEELCNHITDNYILANKYPELAVAEGFIIPADARLNAINYCYSMIGDNGRIMQEFYAKKEAEGYQPREVYDAAKAEEDRYKNILYNWLKNEDLPWRAPRYGYLRTDYGTTYVDSEGNATDWTNSDAQAENYAYGNGFVGIQPFTSPHETGVHDYGSPTWDTRLDENGNPTNEEAIYDEARAAGTVKMGRPEWVGREAIDIMSENGLLGEGDRPTLGVRDLEPLEGTIPEYLRNPTAGDIESMLGIHSYLPGDEEESEGSTSQKSGGNGGGGGYGGTSYSGRGWTSYPRRSYGGGSYGGGYSSGKYASYNPKIYSTSRNVSGGRAAGMDVRSPYKATNTYLHPSFYTKGSSEAYKRSDI